MLAWLLAASLLGTGEQRGGTTIVAIKTRSGIVVAGDARAVGSDGGVQPDAIKVLEVRGCVVGTWGMVHGWFDFPPHFETKASQPRRVTYDFEPFVREATAGMASGTPHEIAAALKHALENFYTEWRYYAHDRRAPAFARGPDYLGFLVAGYEQGRAIVLTVRIPRDPASNSIRPPEMEERIPATSGFSVAGASASIQRVTSAEGKERQIARRLAPSATEKALQAGWPWLTLEEARRYALTLIFIEAVDDPGVGFPVRLATVGPKGEVSMEDVSEGPGAPPPALRPSTSGQ